MKLSSCGLNDISKATTPISVDEKEGEDGNNKEQNEGESCSCTNSSSIMENNELYIVHVDSRDHSPSDLECYKEMTCNDDFFMDHIHDDPHNTCTKSQIAGLCGLDLKIYFHDHHKSSMTHLQELYKPLSLPSTIGPNNGIATLLLFNPETGTFNHMVQGKAYVLLNDGKSPLSKRQVWGIVEFIREIKAHYESIKVKYEENQNTILNHLQEEHKADHDVATNDNLESSPALREAYADLLKMCTQYQNGTWAPHGIYEPRHNHHHHHHHHHNDYHHSDKKECKNIVDKKIDCDCKHISSYQKQESGLSDAATCHHGLCHTHHDVKDDHHGHYCHHHATSIQIQKPM